MVPTMKRNIPTFHLPPLISCHLSIWLYNNCICVYIYMCVCMCVVVRVCIYEHRFQVKKSSFVRVNVSITAVTSVLLLGCSINKKHPLSSKLVILILKVQPKLSSFYITLSYLFVSKGMNNFLLPLHSLRYTFGLFHFLIL